MSIKISTGKLKGKTLCSTDSARELRPSQSKIREAIISILKNLLIFKDSSALDLFAGIGSVSMELISNEIKSIDLVEKDPRCIKIIKKNLCLLDFQSKSRLIRGDTEKFFKKNKKIFELIFMDPPYDLPFKKLSRIFQNLIKFPCLKNDGILVIECNKTEIENLFNQENPGNFLLLKKKKYGDSLLLFWKFQENFSKNTL
jgi:16S rRNA (guanine966-N2)-methyltransferase